MAANWSEKTVRQIGKDACDQLSKVKLEHVEHVYGVHACTPEAHNILVDASNHAADVLTSVAQAQYFLTLVQLNKMEECEPKRAPDTHHEDFVEVTRPFAAKIPVRVLKWTAGIAVGVYLLVCASFGVAPLRPLKRWIVGEEQKVVAEVKPMEYPAKGTSR